MDLTGGLENKSVCCYRLLIAEDELDILTLMKEYLAEFGAKVTIVSDGQEAVDMFEKHPSSFDLLILDVKMPKLSGIEAYKKILEVNQKMPVIFLSGAISAEGFLEENREKPYIRILEKPFRLDVLWDCICSVLLKGAVASQIIQS